MAKKYYFDESGFFFEDKEKTILVGCDIHQDFPEDIYIPSTTKLIKKNALMNINAPESTLHIPSSVEMMEPYLCNENTLLDKVIFEEGIKVIGSESFASTPIENFVLPKSLERIQGYAFINSSVKNINLGNVKSLGKFCFANSKIRNARLENVELIEKNTFTNCHWLESMEVCPKEAVVIPSEFCCACSNLKNLVLKNVSIISEKAFKSTAKLCRVYLSNDLKRILDNAFTFSGFPSLYIPASVEYIGGNAFSNCASFEECTIENDYSGHELFIDTGAFSGCAFKEFTIPSSVTEMGQYGILANIDELEVLRVEANVSELPEFFAANCENLREIYLSPKIETVKKWAFENTGFITIGPEFKNIKTFERNAFQKCKRLENIILHNKNSVLEDAVFEECPKLSSAIICCRIKDPSNIFKDSGNVELLLPKSHRYKYTDFPSNVTVVKKADEELIAKLSEVIPFKELSKTIKDINNEH